MSACKKVSAVFSYTCTLSPASRIITHLDPSDLQNITWHHCGYCKLGVAVKVGGYSTATALHGSSCWSSHSIPSQLLQLAVVTVILHYTRPT